MARTLPQLILQWTVLLLVLVPAMAQALSSDRRQPITIEADRATLNENDGSSIYEGNVHLQQGTLNLRGDRMTVQMSDNAIEKIVLTGQLASYQQRPDDRDSDQHAEARRIEYHAADQRMILLENARVWQSDTEDFRSDRIVYNMKNNTVSAGGGSATDRVRITLQPKNKPDEEQEAPAAVPAADGAWGTAPATDTTETTAPATAPATDTTKTTQPATPPATGTTVTTQPATPPSTDTTKTTQPETPPSTGTPAPPPATDGAWVTTPAIPPATDAAEPVTGP